MVSRTICFTVAETAPPRHYFSRYLNHENRRYHALLPRLLPDTDRRSPAACQYVQHHGGDRADELDGHDALCPGRIALAPRAGLCDGGEGPRGRRLEGAIS